VVIVAEVRNAYRILVMKSLDRWPFETLRSGVEKAIVVGGGKWRGKFVPKMKNA
jgi:hypothetical protein